MMRAGVLCVIAVLVSVGSAKVQLVSQSAKGPLTATYGLSLGIPGFKGSVNGTMSLYMDVEIGSLRMDLNLINTPSGKDPDIDYSDSTFILNGKTKSAYHYMSVEQGGDGCEAMQLPSLPEPSQFVACAADLLEKGKKQLSMHNVYVVEDDIASNIGPITVSGSMGAGMWINIDGGIPKIDFSGSLGLFYIPLFSFGGEWSAAESSFGTPDSSVFDPPAEWGSCAKQEVPISANLSKTEQAWLKCIQPEVVLADGLVVV